MKFYCAFLLASAGSAAAFVAPQPKTSIATALSMSDEALQTDMPTSPTEPKLPIMSQSLPFMERPAALDGSLPGDVGFDPLGFAKSKEDLFRYREAEVKHAVSFCCSRLVVVVENCRF